MTPAEFGSCLRAYCAWSRGSVTSWIRSPERNQKVGGHPDSSHLLGLAADVAYTPNPRPALPTARKRAHRLGLRLVREGDHDHLQAI